MGVALIRNLEEERKRKIDKSPVQQSDCVLVFSRLENSTNETFAWLAGLGPAQRTQFTF